MAQKTKAQVMRGPIVRNFNAQQLDYAVKHTHGKFTEHPAWAPDTDLQDLQSHCEVKELAGAEGEKAWDDSLFVQDFEASFNDTIPGPL